MREIRTSGSVGAPGRKRLGATRHLTVVAPTFIAGIRPPSSRLRRSRGRLRPRSAPPTGER